MADSSPRKLITRELLEVEACIQASSISASEPLASMMQRLINSGGKRVRPMLTVLMGRICGAPEASLIPLASAMEILHAATLIHDDLLDDADQRRGQSSLHVEYSTGLAVLCGDYLFAQAAHLVASIGSVELIDRFTLMVTTIVLGETTQLANRWTIPSMEAYEQRIYAKTAAMMETLCACACLLGGMPSEEIEAAGRFGREFGIAFQIADDLLDYAADEHRIGKPTQHDLSQGLFTLPVLIYSTLCPMDQDLKVIQAGRRLDANIPRLVQAIRSSEALDITHRKAQDHILLALQALDHFPESPFRTTLKTFCQETLTQPK